MTGKMATQQPYLVFTAIVALLAVAVPAVAQQTVGVFKHDESGTFDGLTLIAPLESTETYLVDEWGREVHRWSSPYRAGLSAYLLPNGHLVRGAQTTPDPRFANAPGFGGRVEEYDWDGNLVWSFDMATAQFQQHHDIEVLPNGNVLMMIWEVIPQQDALDAGRDPNLLPDSEVWPDKIIEVQRLGPNSGDIVWEWRVWDHLVQDFNSNKDNFGVVADHPRRMDVNYSPGNGGDADWNHFNGIHYNADFDQIVLSVRGSSELWVIDHSTTTAEAAGSTGGNYGKGGDFLYRWGNPEAYGRGGPADRTLDRQHDTQWILPGLPGEGNMLMFNNGFDVLLHSQVDEIQPPQDPITGEFVDPGASAWGPLGTFWSYEDDPPENFFAPIISGAFRMPNGNTVVTEGTRGRIFEVTDAGEVVWDYVNPLISTGAIAQGDPPAPRGLRDENGVFKVRKYPYDYPAFDGRDLTPGAHLESFTEPIAVDDGTLGGNPLRANTTVNPGEIQVTWDVSACNSVDYNLLHGQLADVSTLTFAGAECGLGTTGTHLWTPSTGDDSFFLLVGTDGTGVYESSWGRTTGGVERNGLNASGFCGATNKVVTGTCP